MIEYKKLKIYGGVTMITKETNILEAVRSYPQVATIFSKYGLGCIGCMVAAGETIGEGLAAHGLDADVIVAEINKLIEETK
jgi:hybrid cluster-associated redox disulfide protein